MERERDKLAGKLTPSRPTYVRVFILALLCLAASVAYLCRNSIGVAESTIRSELKLSEDQMGWVISCLFLTYALGQIPLGWLAARIGSRRGIAVFSAVWSLATASMSLATMGAAMPVLIASRAMNGVAQAGLFPASTASVARWLPSSQRAVASGSLGSFMSIGGAVGVAITGYLITRYDWRSVFTAYGAIGLLFAVVFWLLFRNSPDEHGWVNDEERELIGEYVAEEKKQAPGSSWEVFLSLQTWFISGQQFCRAAGQIFFASWFATYLQETRGVTVASSGFLNSIPLLSIVAGSFIGGAVSDTVLHSTGSRRFARSGVAVVSMSLCAVFVLGAYFIADPVYAVLTISMGTFFAAVGGPCAYAVTIDMGERNVAVLFATMNMVGNLGAFAFIRAVPTIIEVAGWTQVLSIFGALYVGAAICWAFINPDRRLTGEAA